MRLSAIAVFGLPLALAGCGYGASKAAHQAQISMVGMSEADLQACAGPPDKTIALNELTDLNRQLKAFAAALRKAPARL